VFLTFYAIIKIGNRINPSYSPFQKQGNNEKSTFSKRRNTRPLSLRRGRRARPFIRCWFLIARSATDNKKREKRKEVMQKQV